MTGYWGSDVFDVVVAGARHNSLVTAAYLAKAKMRCLVAEGRPLIAGSMNVNHVHVL